MMGRSSVSIVIATYNGGRYLQEQLASLATQSFPPTEVLIGDDGSTDDTLDVVRAFAETAPFPVRLTQNAERLGYSENFLQIAMRSQSTYVAFCDQDDIWLPNKLERCVASLELHNASLCAHDAIIVSETLERQGILRRPVAPGVHGVLTLNPWDVFHGFTAVFRRDLLDIAPAEARPDDNIKPDQKLAHDRWVYFLSTTFGSTVYLPEPLALYRQHQNNLFGARAGGSLRELLERFRTARSDQESHLAICNQRIAILERVAAESDDAVGQKAIRGAAYWRRMASIYRHRLGAASLPSLRRRLLSLLKLVELRSYSSFAKGGLTLRAFIKDLINALSAGRRRAATAIKAERITAGAATKGKSDRPAVTQS